MLDKDFFDQILSRAGIDLALVDDPSRILDLAEEIYFDVALDYANSKDPLTQQEETDLLNTVADRLVKKLYEMFHEHGGLG